MSARGSATVLGLAVGLALTAAAPATAVPRTSNYSLAIGADAVQPYLVMPRELRSSVAHSSVWLLGGRAVVDRPTCTALGAGYWLGPELELELGDRGSVQHLRSDAPGARPAAPGGTPVPNGLYGNPTVSRSVNPPRPKPDAPFPIADDGSNRRPDLRENTFVEGPEPVPLPASGPVPRWSSSCKTPLRGEGVSEDVSLTDTVLASSRSTGAVNRRTGGYAGSSTTKALRVPTPHGTLGFVVTMLTVSATPKTEPRLSFRVAIGGAESVEYAPWLSRGVVLEALDVPASQLIPAFNEQVRANATALAALAKFGVEILPPTSTTSECEYCGDRIAAPVVLVHAGPTLREGTIGQDQGVRLGVAWFEGRYHDRSR